MKYPISSSLKPTDIEYMIEEINSLNKEAHEYLRMPHLLFSLAISVLPLFIVQVSNGKSADIVLLVAPLICGILATYNLNIAAEAAGLAEMRDRLANKVNLALNQPIYLMRLHSRVRRGYPGTIAAYSLVSIVIAITIAHGLVYAWQVGGWRWGAQIVVTLISVVAVMVAIVEFVSTRKTFKRKLDTIFESSHVEKR